VFGAIAADVLGVAVSDVLLINLLALAHWARYDRQWFAAGRGLLRLSLLHPDLLA
jgi:hypothetical protein